MNRVLPAMFGLSLIVSAGIGSHAQPMQWTTQCSGDVCVSVTPEGQLFSFDLNSGPTYRTALSGFVGPARVTCEEAGACVVRDAAGHVWNGNTHALEIWAKAAERKRSR